MGAATEIRRDSIVDRWVIFAPARAARPNEYSAAPPAHGTSPCPFCEGYENLATPEIAAIRRPGTSPQEPGWQVRVVPNKYPALSGIPASDDAMGSGVGFANSPLQREYLLRETDSRPVEHAAKAIGIHEVIIESPQHIKSVTELTANELADVLTMYRSRLAFAAEQPEVRHALVFKNVGPGAGASMEHIHSQLIGLPLVPAGVAEELSAAEVYREEHNACVYCDLLDREREAASRVVEETANFQVLCPYASRFPFEMWLFPRMHESRFDRIPEPEIPELAQVLRSCIERIERTTGRSEYNYLIHSAPFDTCCQSHYHWHIEIFPRLARTAGFEWGTGMFINSVFPEEAARKLRAALS